MKHDFYALPAVFDHDRIFLCPVTAQGEELRFYTDSGGGGMFIERSVVERLHLPTTERSIETGEVCQFTPFPVFREDVSIPPGVAITELGIVENLWETPGFLGQSWFADRIWKLDYRNQYMGYRTKGPAYDTDGFQSCPVYFKSNDNGDRIISFPRITATIDGETLDFLFDTGATVRLTDEALRRLNDGGPARRGTSFITQSIFDRWQSRHPDWTVIDYADTDGAEAMIQVPVVEVAGLEVGPAWFTRRPDSNFHEYMSQWMDRQIDGALGGSVFKYFSIIIDYLNAMAYFKA